MLITIHSDFLSIKFQNEAFRLSAIGNLLRICILSVFLALTGTNLHAQLPAIPQDTAKATMSQITYPPDSLGRRTPRGAVDGFLRAASQNNFKKAALYLRRDPALKKKQDRTRQAKALNALVEAKGNIYPYSWISNDYEGKKDDELGPNLDRIGAVEVNNESVELILESTKDASGGPIWLFSTQTIERIPLDSAQIASSSLLSKLSPKILIENDWGGVPIAHWVAMLLLIIFSFVMASVLARLFLRTVPLVYRKAGEEPISGVLKAFSLPARLYLAVLLFIFLSREAGISIVVRQWFSNLTLIVGLVAGLLLVWELVDVATRLSERRMARRRNQAAVSAILFSRRALKIAIVVGGILLMLDTFGFDVSTGLAALGIGGIALALGTQKTVENFIGSVTIIADQPIRVGDFCRIGDIAGTIEQIGMRATRVRTNDRTVVSIPNGDLSSLKIENLAYREKFWFHPVFNLRIETTPDQIRQIVGALRNVLLTHPRVDPSPARVRFIGVGLSGVQIEIFSYINTGEQEVFLEIQEELLLKMMEVITNSGTALMLPSQTIYFAKDHGLPQEESQIISPE